MVPQKIHPRVISHEDNVSVLQAQLIGKIVFIDFVRSEIATEIYERR